MSVSITIGLGSNGAGAAKRGEEKVEAKATVDESAVAESDDLVSIAGEASHSTSSMSIVTKSTVSSDDLGWFMMAFLTKHPSV